MSVFFLLSGFREFLCQSFNLSDDLSITFSWTRIVTRANRMLAFRSQNSSFRQTAPNVCVTPFPDENKQTQNKNGENSLAQEPSIFRSKLSEISAALIEDSSFASSFRGGSSKSEESKGEQKIFILSVVAYPEEKQKNEKTNVKPKPKIRKPDKNSTQILIHELTRVR